MLSGKLQFLIKKGGSVGNVIREPKFYKDYVSNANLMEVVVERDIEELSVVNESLELLGRFNLEEMAFFSTMREEEIESYISTLEDARQKAERILDSLEENQRDRKEVIMKNLVPVYSEEECKRIPEDDLEEQMSSLEYDIFHGLTTLQGRLGAQIDKLKEIKESR